MSEMTTSQHFIKHPTRDFSVAYGFDNLDRLDTSQYTFIATSTVTPAMQPDDDFGYDANGNRLSSAANPSYSNPQFNNLNRLLNDGTYTYAYDHNGNTVKKTEKANPGNFWKYHYNFKNQLMSAESFENGVRQLEAVYRYDPLGRRIARGKRLLHFAGFDTVDKYIYDGDDVRFEFQARPRHQGMHNDKLRARYTHGPGIDEPLVFWYDADSDDSLEPYFYHFDGLGSVTAMTDAGGEIVAKYVYDAFGNAVQQCGPIAALNRYMFTAREYDVLIQLYFNRARYYDPRIGRFREEDQDLHPNLYFYVSNKPTQYIDSNGNKLVIVINEKILKDNSWNKFIDKHLKWLPGNLESILKYQTTPKGVVEQNVLGAMSLSGSCLGFASEKLLVEHFVKHGRELGYVSKEAYLAGARYLSIDKNIVYYFRSNGDKVIYKVSSNEFLVIAKDGTFRTYFKPDSGMSYFLDDILKNIGKLFQ